MIDRRGDQLGKVLVCFHAVTIQHRGRATRSIDHDTHGHRMSVYVLLKRTKAEREKVGFIEKTAMRHRWGGGREVTVTSRLHRQKDTERQRKTEENVERRPGVTPRCDAT